MHEQAEKLRKEHEGFQLHQLFSGEAGKCFFHVPSEMHGNHKISEVYLIVEGDGEGRVFILNALGPDKKRALNVRDANIYLSLLHLEIPHPPRIETMKEKWDFSHENAEHYQRFWSYMSRARKAQEEQKKKEAATIARAEQKKVALLKEEQQKVIEVKAQEEAEILKKEYADEATIDFDRVIQDGIPQEGIFFAEFKGNWHNPNGSIIPDGLLYFQGEKRVVDGILQMKIRKAPAHLFNGFFIEPHTRFASYDQFFGGLEQPLQGLMKALRTKAKLKKV
jgi:hypothetical protein